MNALKYIGIGACIVAVFVASGCKSNERGEASGDSVRTSQTGSSVASSPSPRTNASDKSTGTEGAKAGSVVADSGESAVLPAQEASHSQQAPANGFEAADVEWVYMIGRFLLAT